MNDAVGEHVRAGAIDESGVLASLPDPVLVVGGADGRVVLANAAAAAWLGADASALLGHTVLDQEGLVGLACGEQELLLLGLGGRARPCRAALSQRRVANLGSVWILLVRSDALACELALLRERLARHRRIELGTDEGAWEWVPSTGENYFSSAWCALVGHSDELPQRVDTFVSRVHPDDLDMLWAAVERHRRGEAPFDVEHRMRHRDGSYRWMRSRGRFSCESGVVRLTGLLTDITERKRIEAALQEAQWLARLGAWESDLDGGDTWWSDQMYAIAGVDPGTPMTTGAVTSFVHPDDRASFAAGVREAIEQGSHVGQVRIVRSDGSTAHVRLIGRVQRDAAGKPTRMSGACLDVSDQVEAAAAIRRSLAEKDTLLREIHHRVKNNLAVVGSLLHFHGMQLESARDLEVLEGLRRRIHAMSLVHDRLYQLPNVAHVEFGDYARVLVADLCRGSSSRGVVVEVACEELHLPIETAMPLGQITCELVTNVLKYAFVAGRGGRARVALQRYGEQGELVVEDDGVGLPEDFDPTRVSSFGWLLVRSLVRQLDGTYVLARPAGGSGTRVEVRFAWP